MTRERGWIGGFGLAAVCAFALAAGFASAEDAKTFRHAIHLENEIACTICHAAVLADEGQARTGVADDLCASCHYKGYPPAAKSIYEPTKRSIHFVHSEHADVLPDCTTCHRDPEARITQAEGHAACGACHAEQIDGMLCALCHADWETAGGLSRLAEYRHAENFLNQHGPYAARATQVCAQCHRERFCTECHSKRADLKPSLIYPESPQRGFVHRGDTISLHRYQARADDTACLKCHAQKECRDCHVRKGITPAGATRRFSHPAGFDTNHGSEARKDILACASCHDGPGPGDCTTCHRASAGVNPHPSGWNPGVSASRHAMCQKCHGR